MKCVKLAVYFITLVFPGTGQERVMKGRRKRGERGNSQDQRREICLLCRVGCVYCVSVYLECVFVSVMVSQCVIGANGRKGKPSKWLNWTSVHVITSTREVV